MIFDPTYFVDDIDDFTALMDWLARSRDTWLAAAS